MKISRTKLDNSTDLSQRAVILIQYTSDRCEHLGMNMSTAFNIFLRKAVNENAIPFPVSTKNNSFIGDYSEDDITKAFQAAVLRETVMKKQRGTPVARYDTKTRQAYLEYPDATRECAENKDLK